MQRKQFRAKKAVRMKNSTLNRGPRQRGRGDGGHIPENLLEPVFVDECRADRLSRERAGILAQLRKLDAFDEARRDLESAAFWIEQRLLGMCA